MWTKNFFKPYDEAGDIIDTADKKMKHIGSSKGAHCLMSRRTIHKHVQLCPSASFRYQ